MFTNDISCYTDFINFINKFFCNFLVLNTFMCTLYLCFVVRTFYEANECVLLVGISNWIVHWCSNNSGQDNFFWNFFFLYTRLLYVFRNVNFIYRRFWFLKDNCIVCWIMQLRNLAKSQICLCPTTNPVPSNVGK